MAAKTTDWRPGPTVCRCCLSEGCYKDISTEYFWMGKREVYSEMLSETFSLAIAYSTSGGPNSNSRLICEPCISRLRDASDFKRQVQECEKTFMQYLDPGSEPLSDFDDTRVEVSVEQMQTQVKVEQVKTEKDDASEPEDFDDRADYLDDDDDDLDDQPLTRLATKVPKKESVDLLDLLDSTKTAEKRKSTTKVKAGPAKKAKTKKEVVKATSSKASKQTEKKKKGEASATEVRTGVKLHNEVYLRDLAQKKVGRQSAIALIHGTNVCPFRFNGSFMCLYCPRKYSKMPELAQHVENEHNHVTEEEIRKAIVGIRKYQPIKVNMPNFGCKLCNKEMFNFEDLKHHLIGKHKRPIDLANYGVWPHNITEDQFNCVLCGLKLEDYRLLNKHIIEHYTKSKDKKGDESLKAMRITTNNTIAKCSNEAYLRNLEQNKISRASAIALIHSTNICPFRFNGSYMCLYCSSLFEYMPELAQHVELEHKNATIEYIRRAIVRLRKYQPIKVNVLDFGCKLCNDEISNFEDLKLHLINNHQKPIDLANCGVWPYKITNDEFSCVLCDEKSGEFRLLTRHISEHFTKAKNKKGDAKANTVRIPTTSTVFRFSNETYLRELEQKKVSRESAIALIHNANVCPFKYSRFYMCLYCPSRYVTMSELTEHVDLEHKDVTVGEIRKAIIRIHCYKPIKINVLDFGCKLCNDEISNFSDLKHHLIAKHNQPVDFSNDGVWPYKITEEDGFICLLCDKKFGHYWLLNRHINEHFTKYICDQCGTGFASDLRLRTHVASHIVGCYPCEECGKVFTSTMLKQQHIERVHRKAKKHKCLYCTETFREYNHKQKHLRTVHGVKTINYKCKFCPKVFDSTSSVRSHERHIHIKLQKYKCDICNYACSIKTMLSDHMMCHTDKKNFECQVCKKTFARKKSLAEHMKIHNNDKRFVCQHCDRAFVQKCSLTGHMKTHHKEFLV